MIRTTGKTKTKARILINFKSSHKNKGKFEKKSKGEIERKKVIHLENRNIKCHE